MNIYQQAIKHFGIVAQVTQAMEESGELITVLNKFFFRDKATKQDVAGEIADVQIMLNQLKEMIGHDKVNAAMNMKLDRLKETIRGKG